MSKDYVENHVRFLDEDGQTITVLCTKGDILEFVKQGLYRAYDRENKDVGYAVLRFLSEWTGSHLVRPDVSDDTVENVYVVAEVDGRPWITAFSNVDKKFFYEGPV